MESRGNAVVSLYPDKEVSSLTLPAGHQLEKTELGEVKQLYPKTHLETEEEERG